MGLLDYDEKVFRGEKHTVKKAQINNVYKLNSPNISWVEIFNFYSLLAFSLDAILCLLNFLKMLLNFFSHFWNKIFLLEQLFYTYSYLMQFGIYLQFHN